MRAGNEVLWRLAVAAAGGLVVAVHPGNARAQEKGAARASPEEYEGWRQYMVHCARCHGDDAVGGIMAPDLRGSIAKGAVTEATFRTTVTEGRRGEGMPGFEGVLTPEQTGAIHSYVAARAKGKLSAGRPRT